MPTTPDTLCILLDDDPIFTELDEALWAAYVPTFGDPAEPRYRRALDFRVSWARTIHAWLDTVEPMTTRRFTKRRLQQILGQVTRMHLVCEWVGGMDVALLRRLSALTGLSPAEAEELADRQIANPTNA